jgi:hypothetical protein
VYKAKEKDVSQNRLEMSHFMAQNDAAESLFSGESSMV